MSYERDEAERKQKIFGPRVFCFGWYDHGRCGTDPAAGPSTNHPDDSMNDNSTELLKGNTSSSSKRTLALRPKSSKKKAALKKYQKYTKVPVPVNTLTSAQITGSLSELAVGERHTLVITSRGQVLAFGDNTKYALGSKVLFKGRTASPSRSSTRPNTAVLESDAMNLKLPSLLPSSSSSSSPSIAAAPTSPGKIIPGTNTSTLTFKKKPDTLESDKRRWNIQDQLPRLHNSDTPVEVDLHRAGCLIPVHVYAGACTSYVLDGNGKLYSWGENHHGQCGVGSVDFTGMSDDEIKQQLDTMRKGPVSTKAKRWKAPGTEEKEKKDEEGDEFLAGDSSSSSSSSSNNNNNSSALTTTAASAKKSNTAVTAGNGSVSGLRRGGGYTVNKKDSKNSAAENWETVRKKVVKVEEKEEIDPYQYGTTVTNKLKIQPASRPMTRRAYVERPLLIAALAHKRVKMIACGHRHVVALMLGGGLLYSWGLNRYGQLGLGGKDAIDTDYKDRDVPCVISTMRKVRCSHISCGRHFTVALGETNDDRFLGIKLGGRLRRSKQKKKCMFVFGQNDYGQFGCKPNLKNRNEPHCFPTVCKAEVVWSPKTPDKEVVEVYAGGNHLIMKCLGETLCAVGNNRYGQLGLGDLYDRDYPMYIDTIGGVKMVSSGARHTMATTANNVLYVWGFNVVGEMGTGTKSVYLLPEPVRAMRELRPLFLCAGDWHSSVIATDMPDESVPMWREPNCHPDMLVEDDAEGHDSLTISHRLNADQMDDPM